MFFQGTGSTGSSMVETVSREAEASPSTPGDKSNDAADGFLTSLAALKEILLLDTPTKSILKGPTPDQLQRRQLTQQIQCLQKALTVKEEQNEAIREELEESLQNLEGERTARLALKGISKEKAELVKEFQELTATQAELTAERNDLRKLLDSIQKQHADALQQLEGRLKQLEEGRIGALERSDAMDARRLSSERRAEELAKERHAAVDLMHRERSKFEEVIESLERTTKNLQGRCDRAERSKAKLIADFKSKSVVVKEIRAELEHTKQQLQEAKAEVTVGESVKRKLEEAVSSQSLLKKRILRLEENILSEKSQVSILKEKLEKQIIESEAALTAQQGNSEELMAKSVSTLNESFDKKRKEVELQNNELESDLEEMRKTLEAKGRLHAMKEKESLMLRTKNKELEKEAAQLRRNDENYRKLVESETATLKLKVAETERERSRVQENLECDLKTLRAHMIDKNAALKRLEASAEHEKTKVESYDSEVAGLKQELITLKSSLNESEARAAATKSSLQSELDETRAALAARPKKLLDKEISGKTFETRNDMANKRANDMGLQHTTAIASKNCQQSEDASHVLEMESLRGALAASEHELSKNVELLNRCQNQIDTFEAERHRSEREIGELTEKVQASASVLSTREEKEMVLAGDMEGLHSTLIAKEKLLESKDRYSELLKSKYESAEGQIGELRMKLDDARNAPVSLEMSDEAKATKDELMEVKDELECAEEEVARCRTRLAKLENDLGKRNVAIKTKDDELLKLRLENDSLRSLASLEKQAAFVSVNKSAEGVSVPDEGETTKGLSDISPETGIDKVQLGDVVPFNRKRPAGEAVMADQHTGHVTGELDTLKAKLLAKKKQRAELETSDE